MLTLKEKQAKERDAVILSLYEKFQEQEPNASFSRLSNLIAGPTGYSPVRVRKILNTLIPTNNA